MTRQVLLTELPYGGVLLEFKENRKTIYYLEQDTIDSNDGTIVAQWLKHEDIEHDGLKINVEVP